jgi:hypothetical protein
MPIPAFAVLALAASLACGVAHAQPASLVANAVHSYADTPDVEAAASAASRHGAVPVSFRFLHAEEGHEIALTDVHVVIVTPLGHPLFEAVSDGPFLMANVPFGRYEVVASHEGRSRRVALDVSRDDAMLVAIHW